MANRAYGAGRLTFSGTTDLPGATLEVSHKYTCDDYTTIEKRTFYKTEQVVYLLHLSEKLAGRSNHYMGTTHNLDRRLYQHSRLATSAAMLKAPRAKGITWVVVRTWPGGHALERKLTNLKNHKKLCPICLGEMDNSAILRSEGYPSFSTFTGKRKPMDTHYPTFVHRVVD